ATADMSEAELASLVTRDSLIGFADTPVRILECRHLVHAHHTKCLHSSYVSDRVAFLPHTRRHSQHLSVSRQALVGHTRLPGTYYPAQLRTWSWCCQRAMVGDILTGPLITDSHSGARHASEHRGARMVRPRCTHSRPAHDHRR